MDCLSSTLSSCAFNHSRLESLFSKKQTPHIHAQHHHAYAYVARHDHTHTHKHIKVYKCTHCGCKGHLAKFCYDKIYALNFAKKNVWVPYKTNLKDPKEMGTKVPTLFFWCRWGLSQNVRVLVPWWWLHGLEGHIWCTAIKEVWWDNHHVWSFRV